mmetsp:Transcript_25676/g.45592  ORF Transcript_25676/g.45592 Transcript_25676/m.45592 type:complete len:345 (-) Transcript_25676:195-1229(-)
MYTNSFENFFGNVSEIPGLEAVGLKGVAVHRIADPNDFEPCIADGLDERRKGLEDLFRAKTRNQDDFTRLVLRIEGFDKFDQEFRSGSGTDFYTDGVVEATEVFNVGVLEAASAVTDPEHMSGCVVVDTVCLGCVGGLFSGHGFFVFHEKAFVGDKEVLSKIHVVLDCIILLNEHVGKLVELVVVLAEAQHAWVKTGANHTSSENLADLLHHFSAGSLRNVSRASDEIQAGGRAEVALNHSVRVRDASVDQSVSGVHDISFVRLHSDAIDYLSRRRAGFCILTRHSAKSHDRQVGVVGDYLRHNVHYVQHRLDLLLLTLVESLSAMATLQVEGSAFIHRSQLRS